MILYWDRSTINDKTVDFRGPDVVLIDRENKTTYVTDRAVLYTHNLSKIEVDKIMKYEN